MAANDDGALASARRGGRGSQTFVLMAMGLVAIAAAAAMHSHLGLPTPIATTVALAAFVLVYAIHSLLWRNVATEDAGDDRPPSEARGTKVLPGPEAPARPAAGAQARDKQPAASRTEAVLASLSARQAPRPLTPGPLVTGPMFKETHAAAELARPPARGPQPPTLPTPAERAPDSTWALRPDALPAARPEPRPEAGAPQRASLRADRAPPPPPTANTPPPPPPGGDSAQDYWSYRPAAPRLPPFVTGRVTARGGVEPTRPAATPPAPSQTAAPSRTAAPSPVAPPPIPAASAPREADVEVVQDAIKRLLQEVNSNEAHDAAPASGPISAQRGRAPAAGAEALPAQRSDAVIESSLDALRLTAHTMRAVTQPARTATQPARAATPPPAPSPAPAAATPAAWSPPRPAPAHARAQAIADAIAADRIDVLLEPILGLDDRRTRHFEVTIRLRDAIAGSIDMASAELRGTGLLPLFDRARISRTAAVARRLDERGKNGMVLSAFTGESLVDENFLGDLAETIHRRAGFAGQLVLTFSQDDVRGFGTPEWDTIADMRTLGLRFALSDVTDLDTDFEALAEAGFAFIKLDADVLLSGMPMGAGRIPAADVCRHIAKLGLAIVVERIADEEKLARVFGFGVLLGQGQLFGGARPVKASAVGSRAEAAA